MDLSQETPDEILSEPKKLTEDEQQKLAAQNSRLVPDHKSIQLEKDAKKHWDLFYKRNETRFFKDRRWTTREFEELLSDEVAQSSTTTTSTKTMLEVGCGVGNLIYPLIEEKRNNYYIYACDFSPR